MKKKVMNRFIKIAWPVIKFLIINFGQEIVAFTFDTVKQKTERRTTEKIREALEKAEKAEQQAESTSNPEFKIQFYDLAKRYEEDAEYHKRFLHDFLESVEESVEEVTTTVQQKASELDVKDVLFLDEKRGTLEAVPDVKIIEKESKK